MNERIKNLAIQSGITRILNEHAHEYGNGMFENTPYPELEKFAELIVRECSHLVATRDQRREPADYIYLLKVFEIKNDSLL